MPGDIASNVALGFEALIAILPFIVLAVLNVVFARRHWPPLTQLVEDNLRRYPLFAAGLSGFVGALVGHVFWSFGENPPAPPAKGYLLLVAFFIAVAAGALGALVLGLLAFAVVDPTISAVDKARVARASNKRRA